MSDGMNPALRGVKAFIRRPWIIIVLVVLVLIGAAAYVVSDEMASSRWQASYLSELNQHLTFKLEPGPAPAEALRYPQTGPYDQLLGYTALPGYLDRLRRQGYGVEQQARMSPRQRELVDLGLFPSYREKMQAGLTVLDCSGDALFSTRYPERTYHSFETIPPILVQSLLFIENRELLDNRYPTHNPAVDWGRLSKAVIERVQSIFVSGVDTSGGSTLATQIEKYRHSEGGRTASAQDKLRQMASASVRAYRNGEDTTAWRREIVLNYVNTVPLSAKSGYGAVNGLGDGLWAWYGRDMADINRLLAGTTTAPLAERAYAFKQALSLMIAQRRPSYYLSGSTQPLEALTNSYLRLLASAGVIAPAWRDAALAQPLKRREGTISAPAVSFLERKAANATRTRLAGMLGAPRLYDLDHLDLTARSTLDQHLQQAASTTLRSLRDPEQARAAGLIAPRLLETGDPAKVIYSFTLFERTPGVNLVRVQTDNYDQPFDINRGTKLDLGSTAKLRTLVTYLEIVANLHQRYGQLSPEELKKVEVAELDFITRWAIDYLKTAQDRSLKPMLEAALERKYSASPGEAFFTGGGIHTFENFNPLDNHRILTVREGLRNSVNLVFIRLMRDVVRHYMYQVPGSSVMLLSDPNDPRRAAYLQRFADREGRLYLQGFYQKYRGKSLAEAEELLVQGIRPTPVRLAVIFRSLHPDAGIEAFRRFLTSHLPHSTLDEKDFNKLYANYDVERFNLNDRGYLARVHPLELWLLGYLAREPKATLSQALAASREQRQEVYGWLFKSRNKVGQDRRIRQLLEEDAFREIHKSWKRLGYPFDSLVSSYATTLGASADRPAALAELMGILVNDGVRQPSVLIDRLHFAADTPYEVALAREAGKGERLLPAEVAQVARAALTEVVEQGTAVRLKGAFTAEDGSPLPVGGKTGTGDHRFDTFGRGGVLLSSRVVSRSGTFVFFIGDRYFGTLTAYVSGPEAASYGFTSGLPVQIMKVLAPTLTRLTGLNMPLEQSASCRRALT
ncbi:transglycosylase domain-containing protein [Pseudogulbenkiania sp. MAI-1]|uniref:transglycosylase domain-containing protein n=1 Tax=Pseudogulbenkiania sp. MAI-1 TaxID=990370 RepID=UPI0004BBE145|nr:transglycosylase domain-containing protein [Pseudogulbenkiania sp. MAI-1]